jgi:RNA 3'-terminal phosphate cyclase (ATP)
MIDIDGGQRSGSGTIVRMATAFAALLHRPLRLRNARAKREKPGLRPQHLAAVRACADLCDARVEGLAVGSRDLTFVPGARIRGGTFRWEIGTAGSTTMLALGILPVACFADRPVTARIRGGVFQDFAPSPHHLQHVLAPLLARMGASLALRLIRAGYVPEGRGEIEIEVRPVRDSLSPLVLTEAGAVCEARGIAYSSHLEERRVSERMAAACAAALAAGGISCAIEPVYDRASTRPGASLAVWASTSTGCLLGADRAGAPRRASEAIGRFVAQSLLADLASQATVDRHAADQLVPFAALAAGRTSFVVPALTEHVETNLWLAERFGVGARCEQRALEVDGIGLSR